ncbi:MAG: glycosyl transferase family 4, partial [Armatimonadota bacterium]|nr:glycosyl transferase family 4 [Armatimonadota bacterium]
VAGVGWIDDRRGLSPGTRAVAHFAAAAWGLAWLGGFPHLDLGVGTIPLGIVGSLLGLVGIVWMINLYNFMDGIDGLAATEAIMTAGVGGALLLIQGSAGTATLSLILAASAVGFLVWNWAPAKIFMGDVGSGFLGYVLAILAVSTENDHSLPLLVWIILLSVFVVDATATLLRRVRLGEKWHKPHCSHAYQRVTYAGFSHASVTGVIAGINALLGGIAWICWRWPSFLLPGLFVSVSILGFLWYHCLKFPAKPSASGAQ